MSRISPQTLKNSEVKELLRTLSKSLARLNNEKEIEQFISKTLTQTEIIMIARRIKVATLLLAGESYREIEEKLGVGFTTITRVQHWLNDEDAKCAPATTLALQKEIQNRLSKNHKKHGHHIKSEILHDLKNRHPVRFMLLNLLD